MNELNDGMVSEDVTGFGKEYTLRRLKADDMYMMFAIMSKIGIKEIKDCFGAERIKTIMAAMKEREKEGQKEVNLEALGASIAFDVIEILISNIASCKEPLYKFLSQISGMKVSDIANMDMIVFTEMIIDVVKKEEFKDFIKVVSKLFK